MMSITKLSFILCILIMSLCGCTSKETIIVDANVLIVNSEILEGKLIGRFLGSSDGWIKSDVIKVGVKFEIAGRLFLEDLKLSHAQLAYYKDENTLLLEVTVIRCWKTPARLEIRLNGYYIKKRHLGDKSAKQLIDSLRIKMQGMVENEQSS